MYLLMKHITRLKLLNFRRFPSLDIQLDPSLNILIGDNEAGKSTILLAIDLLLRGSRSRVEAVGLENLFNLECISSFLQSDRKMEDLPTLYVEAYLNDPGDPDLNGKNNSTSAICDGLCFLCEPNIEYTEDIKAVLAEEEPVFPFEYYDQQFRTFAAKPYNGYTRPLRHLSIDSSQISNDYATRSYIADLYNDSLEGPERCSHRYNYRRHKKQFEREVLAGVNERLTEYSFAVRTTGKSTLEADLTISEDGITIENKGKGQQCFVKTAFALSKPSQTTQIHVLLLEEPENHLSHVNMKKLIRMIRDPSEKQIVISTHSSLIAARLDLRKCVLMNSASTTPTQLDCLSEDTAEFFMKASPSSVLEFILANKVILVEGNAEYILIEALFQQLTGQRPEDLDTHVISVGGTSFKRYLELASLLGIRTAVLRDNDGDHQVTCIESFKDYLQDHIQVFFDTDNERRTFEICMYRDNTQVCEELFGTARRTLSVEEYMLANKTEAAFQLLRKAANRLSTPSYIAEAVQWING